MLRNSNNVWACGIIQICKILQKYDSFHFYSLCVIVFCLWREVLSARALCSKASKSHSSRGLSGISKSVRWICNSDSYCVMLLSDTALIVEIISEGFRVWEQSTVSLHKNVVDFHSTATQILTECFHLVNISRLNENYMYKMRPLHWYALYMVTVYCFGSRMMT